MNNNGQYKPRLKSLELQGYKTFASRTQFEFPGRITAIVGPNGSGKSNIADALRWVLGEQSYSLLRGRKTEDMIFAGSELRARANMASAVVTFDNADGWLPIDFTEVSVGRKAYRDGQNEYLINGQRVRLKEISELLGQSGLSERTYTIIGQGLVDAALSLKPDERRRFFEEAAGIGLYRSRREEALSRLDATRRNLERVQDILSELAPRLKSLERQARRAEEHDRISAELRELMREWYGYHWHRVQQEVAHAQQVVEAQEERLGLARNRLEEEEAEAAAVRAELQKKRSQLEEWHNQLAALHTRREQVSRNQAILNERQRAAADAEASLLADLARLEEEEKAQQRRLEDMTAEHERLIAELADAKQQAEQARKAMEERQAQRQSIEQALRETRRQLTSLETRQVHVKAHRQELTARLENLARTRQNLTAALEGADQALKEAEEKLRQARQDRTEAELDLSEYDEQVQAQQRQSVELETRRKKLQENLNRLVTQESRLRAQMDVLEQAEASLTGLNQGSKSVLEEMRKGRLPGRMSPLSGHLDVPAEYEVAVAAALGENLDAIYLGGSTDPEPVLQFLETSARGRAILFPGVWLNGAKPVQPPVDDEIIGVASELVKAPADWQQLVNQLLGQVVIVRHRQAARRVLKQLPDTSRVVTLNGEVFAGSGAVIAGQEGRAGLISRPRQKRELQDEIDRVQDQINDLENELEEIEQARQEAQAAQEERERAQRAANQRLKLATQAFQQASLAVDQIRQKQDFQRGQLNEQARQAQKAEEELNRLAEELEQLEKQAGSLREEVRQKSQALQSLPVEELQAQVAHWNTQQAVASRAVKDAAHRMEEYRLSLERNRQQQVSVQDRLAAGRETQASLEQQRNQDRQKDAELAALIDAVQSKIEPAEAELRDVEKKYEDLQGAYQSAQQAVNAVERVVTQAQLEYSRKKDGLENLRRRIEEDFGLVAFEYISEVTGPTPLPLEGLVEQLPRIEQIPPGLEDNINRARAHLRRLGAINPEARAEYTEVKERYEFLNGQMEDLLKADEDLRAVIAELDALMKREFKRTFDEVAVEFRKMFTQLFGGGSARLILTDEDNPSETGIDIEARLPGRRDQGLSLLSGGERSLTAVALVFALLRVSPTPFCVLDEVDAMLDEANVGRFTDLLRELSQTTQFIVITHNRNTVQAADVIYGVTMGKDSASQVISLRLDEISEDMVV